MGIFHLLPTASLFAGLDPLADLAKPSDKEAAERRHREMLDAIRANRMPWPPPVPDEGLDSSDQTNEIPDRKYERFRIRCLRYLWIKCGRPISANDTRFAEPVTPIMDLISSCSFVAQGTDELRALLGVSDAKLEALLSAIARGEKIRIVPKAKTDT